MKRVAITCFALLVLAGCNPYQGVYPELSSTAVTTVTAGVSVETAGPPAADHPDPTPRPSCTVTTGVPAGYLNIRTGAGVQYAVIDQLHEGDRLIILTRGSWLEVETPQHQTGWVNSHYCK